MARARELSVIAINVSLTGFSASWLLGEEEEEEAAPCNVVAVTHLMARANIAAA